MSKRRKLSRHLNNLSLEEKLRVIKAYSEQPSYQELADTFKCTSKQIRNILLEKNNLSAGHNPVQTKKKLNPQLHQKNLKNIALIDSVLKEWYYRAKIYPTTGLITYKTIREKVKEAREALNIDKFIPTNSWMCNFRNDCDRTRANRNLNDELLPLDMKKIAGYVLQQQNVTKEEIKSVYGIDVESEDDDDRNSVHPSHAVLIFERMSRVPNNIKIDLDEFEILATRIGRKDEVSKECKANKLRKDCQPMMELNSSEEALRYLKPLEEFALLNENYRAIGLLTQIEAHFYNTTGNVS